MTKVISFISRKGGTGKTTNAMLLATSLYEMGHRIVVLETDPNYTLSKLRKMELYEDEAPDDIFEILEEGEAAVIKKIKKYRKDGELDFIIVDSAGKSTDENILNLCTSSDIVLIPTSISRNDLVVAYQTIKDLKKSMKKNKDLKLILLPNRIHSSTKNENVRSILEDLETDVLPIYVPSLVSLSQFSTIYGQEKYVPIAEAIIES